MQKGWIVGPALLALAVSGCKPAAQTAPPTPTDVAIKSIYALAACTVASSDVGGVFNIIVPDRLDQNAPNHQVNSKKQAGYNPHGPASGQGNAAYRDNNPTGSNPNPPILQPFDAYMNYTDFDTVTQPYILVRVLTTKGTRWQLYETGDFHGVGGTEGTPEGVICGRNPVGPPSPQGSQIEQIAYFYLDLQKWQAEGSKPVPFVIGLTLTQQNNAPTGTPKVPVFIDPSIHPWGDPIITTIIDR